MKTKPNFAKLNFEHLKLGEENSRKKLKKKNQRDRNKNQISNPPIQPTN